MTKAQAEQPTAAIVDSLRLAAGSRKVPVVTNWQAGAGLEVRGTIADLLMLVTGRTATIDRLHGPGIPALVGLRR